MTYADMEVSREGGPGTTVRLVDSENMGLVLHPFEQRLRPMRARLAALG